MATGRRSNQHIFDEQWQAAQRVDDTQQRHTAQRIQAYFIQVLQLNGFIPTELSQLPRPLYPCVADLVPDPTRLNDQRDGAIVTATMIWETRHVITSFLGHCTSWDHSVQENLLARVKIILILELIGHPSLLQCFINTGFDDTQLPISHDQLTTILEEEGIRDRFLSEQYRTCPRNFWTGEHMVLNEFEPLPFLSIRSLGRGGFGVVDEVQLVLESTRFARKIWRCSSREAAEQLQRESKLLHKLNPHHHIVEFTSTYIRGDELGLLMRPVASCNLWDALRSSKRHSIISDEDLRKALGCLSTGLAYMHERGIRHKDIKPHNVLIHASKFLFTDFGLSLDVSMLSTSVTDGKPAFRTQKYCAPEVADWEGRGRLSDIWALGCVLLETWSVLHGHDVDQPESFTALAPFHENVGKVEEWIKSRLESSADELDSLWLQACYSMLQPQGNRQRLPDILRKLVEVSNNRFSETIFCNECLVQATSIAGVGSTIRTPIKPGVSLVQGVSIDMENLDSLGDIEIPPFKPHFSKRSALSEHFSTNVGTHPELTLPNTAIDHQNSEDPRVVGTVTELISKPVPFHKESQGYQGSSSVDQLCHEMGFRQSTRSIPRSLRIAMLNRFSQSEISGSYSGDVLPYFGIGSFMFPAVIRALTWEMNLRSIAKRMTPGVIRGFVNYSVGGQPWPALVPSANESDKVNGMIVFGFANDKSRRIIHEFTNGMYDARMTEAEIELEDRTTHSLTVCVYVWNGGRDMLVNPSIQEWSPSDLLESHWLQRIVKDVQREENELELLPLL